MSTPTTAAEANEHGTVRVQVGDDGVAVLTLDHARRRNAMTPELGDALASAVGQLRGDKSVRAVVLTGAGEAFSAGGDLKMLQRLRSAGALECRAFMLRFYERYLSVLDLEVPVVSAVHGAAVGAGLCVAIACDLCVVSDEARLGFNFASLGLHPGMGATYLVPLRAGAQRGAELLYSGRMFDGREAVSLGLALESAPTGAEALARATAHAKRIAANAPLAVQGLKRALRIDRAALQRALEHEALHQAESYASADLGEGLAAAGEKRAPKFTGR